MGRMTLAPGLSEDRQMAVLEMREDNIPLAHMIVDAATLEGVIRDLAKCRASMAEAVTPELDPGARLEAEAFPAWRIPDTHSGPADLKLMALRHPGIGWVGFLLEPERAQAIASGLLRQVPPTTAK